MSALRTCGVVLLAALCGVAAGPAVAHATPPKKSAAKTAKAKAKAKKAKERNLDASFETTLSVAPGQIIQPTKVITMWVPKGVRSAGEKMPTCDPARLLAEGAGACPAASIVGDGQGTGLIIQDNRPIGNETLAVTLFNGPGNTLLGLTKGTSPIPINAVVTTTVAKASGGTYGYGQVMRFAFPEELIHPQPGVTASMVSLTARLTGKAGWLRSTSCPRKGWSLGALLTSVDGGETAIMADLACV